MAAKSGTRNSNGAAGAETKRGARRRTPPTGAVTVVNRPKMRAKPPAQAAQPDAKPATGAMIARPPTYDFAAFEARWRDRWEADGIYRVDLRDAKHPYYNLMMFPYPSAEGLHVGNMYAFVGADVHGRWMAMRGYDVFEPMGFDAFGIHSENFAIKMGKHPRALTAQNVRRFREEQLKRIGNRFDWSHEVNTTDPAYYRWTQWIFVKLFKAGLAERTTGIVNWCPNDKTVLADEQVIDGRCERCGAIVERRALPHWSLLITKYADRLLDNLDKLDWSNRVIAAQRNWIGRSTGLEFDLRIVGRDDASVRVFTTRPDTIYGMTFVVLAPEHPLVEQITIPSRRNAVTTYRAKAEARAKASRSTGSEDEAPQPTTGVFTGSYAIHPLTGERVPVWVADYVLMEYGVGAIMAVPAHDERDLTFAHTMGLPVRPVVMPAQSDVSAKETITSEQAFTGMGVLAHSGEFTGMTSAQAQEAIGDWFEQRGQGRRVAHYHLRDWLISRQRYWGPPIPIIYCPEHGAVPVPEDQLPVLLPDTEDYLPTATGNSPLARIESFVNTTCPVCGKAAKRETDVSDNFLDSAWYFLRYPSSGDETAPWDAELTRKWLPVDMYIGGAEHSVLHLLYSRFITMALHDLGYLPFEEPFTHFRAHGMITKDGEKISKSKGNVINPDGYLNRYGADVFRVYTMFMGPYLSGGDFTDRGVGGVVRFLERVWELANRMADNTSGASDGALTPERAYALRTTIERVTTDIPSLKYNTAIATLMSYMNTLDAQPSVALVEIQTMLKLLAPFAPYITAELWARMGGEGSIHTQPWPEADANARPASVTLVVQVDGRLRDRIEAPTGLTEAEARERALASERVQRALGTTTVERVVYAPDRLINLVTK